MNLGFVINNIGPNQLAFDLIHQINLIGRTNVEVSCSLFIQNIIEPCVVPNCAVYNISEIMSFDGVMVATDFDTCEKMLKTTNQALKIFYLWELEWIRNPDKFLTYQSILRTKGLVIFSRSEQYAKQLEEYAGVKSHAIQPTLNVAQLIQNIKRKS